MYLAPVGVSSFAQTDPSIPSRKTYDAWPPSGPFSLHFRLLVFAKPCNGFLRARRGRLV